VYVFELAGSEHLVHVGTWKSVLSSSAMTASLFNTLAGCCDGIGKCNASTSNR
jgi:hypothetical protein